MTSLTRPLADGVLS
jgi:hypothetical protein